MDGFIRGDTLPLMFPIKNDDGQAITMEEIDTIILTARRLPNKQSPVLFQKEKKDFSIEDGIAQVIIQPEDTEQILLDSFSFDIEVTLKDGTRESVIEKIDMKKDFTIHGGEDGD